MALLGERVSWAAGVLGDGVTETPRLEAEILVGHAAGLTRSQLLARLCEERDAPGLEDLVARRLASEPIAYILRRWEFFSLEFIVEPPALVPRPETEHLVEAIVEEVGNRPCRVLELGTGTGCVAVAVAHSCVRAIVTATDIVPERLDLARRNAELHGVAERVQFACGDLFDALPAGAGRFDVVCSNPPYVEDWAWRDLAPVITRYEDPCALLAGPDGLSVIRRLVSGAKEVLGAGGLLAFELGMEQNETVSELLRSAGYGEVSFVRDLAGIERVATARASV